jgi:hypothetical protein
MVGQTYAHNFRIRTVRGNGDAHLLRAGGPQSLVCFSVRGLVCARLRLRISTRCLAFWTSGSDMGAGCYAPLAIEIVTLVVTVPPRTLDLRMEAGMRVAIGVSDHLSESGKPLQWPFGSPHLTQSSLSR